MQRRFRSTLMLLCFVPLLLAACGSEDSSDNNGNGENNGNNGEEPVGGDEVRSDKQRITSPQVPQTDLETQVGGNSAFAFDLYQQIRGEEGNLFYSPHSISLALAMLHAGARGDTEQQMAQALHFDLTQDKLHPVFNQLDLELNSRGQGSKAADGGQFRLNIVNAIWGQRGYPFLPTFLDGLALNYGAGLRVLNFTEKPEDSRQVINDWVEEKTEQRIKDLLPQGTITSLTRLVLTNAIYFNAAWRDPFEESNTKDGIFTRIDGVQVDVPMMMGSLRTGFAQGDGYQAAQMPYDGDELSMLLIVPDAGNFAAFEQGLTSDVVQGVLQELRDSQLELQMPSFEFEAKLGMKKILTDLGMTDAFEANLADLSGIDGSRDLYVTDVLHKAFIKVNEKGTEAAAATGVVVGGTSMPEPAELKIDRPFIFLIQDHATKAILFVGRVVDPS